MNDREVKVCILERGKMNAETFALTLQNKCNEGWQMIGNASNTDGCMTEILMVKVIPIIKPPVQPKQVPS